MLEDEKDVESPDSISTSYESIWTPPGVAYKTGHSGATVPIATYAQSTASPPVQSCTIFMTGTQLCSIDHTGKPRN